VKRAALAAALGMAGCATSRPQPAPKPSPVAQTPPSLQRLCAQSPDCRRDLRLRLRRAGKPDFDQPAGGDDLRFVKRVQTVEHPERTLTFSLSQRPGKVEMTMQLTSGFGRLVKVDLGILRLDDPQQRILKTSSCPILPHGDDYELWPEPLFYAVIARPRLLPQDAPMSCN
jgi:hypothetical protein